MLIAHITDPHIRAGGAFAFGGKVDTSARLAATVDFLNALNPRPDVVLLGGDLVDHGSVEEYRQVRLLLAPLTIPLLVIPGNHDLRDPLRQVFPEVAARAPGPFIQYVVDDYPVRLIGLDTLQDGRVGGLLCRERLDFLSRALSDRPRPTLIFMHHPPYDFGADPNPELNCAGADEMARIVAAQDSVLAIVSGHLHRSTTRRFAGTVASTLPAVSPSFELMLSGGSPNAWLETPPMVGLHVWRPGDGLIAHVAAIDEAGRLRRSRD